MDGEVSEQKKARGIPLTGLENARPETVAIGEKFEAQRAELPFDPPEFMDWEPPDGYAPMNTVDGSDNSSSLSRFGMAGATQCAGHEWPWWRWPCGRSS